ncbi:MAG: TIM barrel protein [Candidatus Thermoplasmatota archaeon]|nr:TIM barrel protein [Candidatus Thermoplasmatota archaeon]
MIRFGPAGIPLSCKGRTLKDGIEDVHRLGLTALEAQLVRAHVQERTAEPEEIGLKPIELPNDMVIEIVRKKGSKEEVIYDLGEPIKVEDRLVTLSSGLANNYTDLRKLKVMAEELDVALSIHTPYYMDLVSDGELSFKSMDSIRWGGVIAKELGGTMVVTHLGLYGETNPKVAQKRIKEKVTELAGWYKKQKIPAPIGLELSGRQEIYGSLSEITKLCKGIDGVVPVINFAHYHAREDGQLKDQKNFETLLESTNDLVKGEYYTHFSGVEHDSGNEKRYTSIKKGDLRFEPLAEAIVDRNDSITIISGSPLLEHDAMYMKVILERVLAKKVSKEVKTVSKKEKAGSK